MCMNQQVPLPRFVLHRFDPTPEDTFLLLDALEADAQDLKNDHPNVCLEIGYFAFIL